MEQNNDLQKTLDEIKLTLQKVEKAKQDLETVLGYAGSLVKYGAVCYTQLNMTNIADGNYIIKYPYSSLPNNGLLFLLPQFSSIKQTNSRFNTLTIKFTETTDTNQTYTGSKTYTMYKESSNGKLSPVTEGDIIANRLAIFRFITGNNNSVILINNPQYNDIQVSTITVTNSTTFKSTPILEKADGSFTRIATEEGLTELEKRLRTVESRILYGAIDPDEALKDAVEGTIYIKVEEI